MKSIALCLLLVLLFFVFLDASAKAQNKILSNKEAAKIFASISEESTILIIRYPKKEPGKPAMQIVTFTFPSGTADIFLNENHPDRYKLHLLDSCTVKFFNKRVDKGGAETVASYLRFQCESSKAAYN